MPGVAVTDITPSSSNREIQGDESEHWKNGLPAAFVECSGGILSFKLAKALLPRLVILLPNAEGKTSERPKGVRTNVS